MNNRRTRMQRSPHYADGVFHNLSQAQAAIEESGWDMLKRQFFGGEQRRPPGRLPLVWPGGYVHATPPASGLRVTWLGHSTLLLELDHLTILTDPVWAERASPVSFAGPRRFHPPPIPLDLLPTPDLILLSHDHYDHLDKAVIRFFADHKLPLVTALGVGEILEGWGIAAERIHELDWWEELELADPDIKIVAVPAQHFSGRSLRRNSTLWSSWVVTSPSQHIFVGCDGGFFAGFAEIGERYGPFDLVSLEIAQYDRAWPLVHMTPEQSVEAALALGAKAFLPVHWGTFCLSFHAWDEPIERTLACAAEHGLRVLTPRLGEPIEPATFESQTWWRSLKA